MTNLPSGIERRISRSHNRPLSIKATVALIAVFFVAVYFMGGDEPGPKEKVVVTHYVQTNESLWQIGQFYCPPDRDIREFIEGIYELNYDTVFYRREKTGQVQPKTVLPGDKLVIQFWAKVRI